MKGTGNWVSALKPAARRSWDRAASYADSNKPGPRVLWSSRAIPITL